MNWNVFLEIFGYIGTALVILSMLMTSVVKLRLINVCGSVISALYALWSSAYPVVLLNVCLVVINVFQLIRMRKKSIVLSHLCVAPNDKSLDYMLTFYADDIKRYFPDYNRENNEAHLVMCGSEIVGLLIGTRHGERLDISVDYATPKYRDLSVSTYLYACLGELGIHELTATQNREYFAKMGFSGGQIMTKTL